MKAMCFRRGLPLMRIGWTSTALMRVIGGSMCQSATERYFCQRMNMAVVYQTAQRLRI